MNIIDPNKLGQVEGRSQFQRLAALMEDATGIPPVGAVWVIGRTADGLCFVSERWPDDGGWTSWHDTFTDCLDDLRGRIEADDEPAIKDHVPPSRKHTDVQVFCLKCGESVGYVVENGHKDWLCETCGDGRMVATTREAHGHPPESS